MKKCLTKQKSILLIEDDLLLRQLYSERLKKEDFCILQATNGIEGLEKIIDCKPSLLLLDLSLPKLSGIEVLRILKQYNKSQDIPIIVLTGIDEVNIKAKCISELEVNNYFIKAKIEPEQLIKKIKKLITIYE